jgi:hypothetical protein
VVFFVTGFVVAAWATRIPAVQERLGFAVYPPALPAVALAPGLGWLAAALAVMAAANSVVDVAMSVQGVELERRYRRPILSGLHAAHPLGMLAGGAGLVAGTVATRWLVAEPRRPRQPRPASAHSPPRSPSGGWPATACSAVSVAAGSSGPAALSRPPAPPPWWPPPPPP